MNKSKVLFITLFLIVAVGIGIMLFSQANNQTIDSTNAAQKQLNTIEILETSDFNRPTAQFKLNVQAKEDFTAIPQKLVLWNKTSRTRTLDLPLTISAYSGECLLHTETLNTMKKWETEWFSLPELGTVDTSYTAKLSDNYSVQVIYADESSEIYQSTNSISGVCYQVSKTEPATPDPREESEEYE